jgi:putative addiction module component (TIGR02574 family)
VVRWSQPAIHTGDAMSDAAEKLKTALLELPIKDRLELMDAIVASLPGPPSKFTEGTPEFDAELDRRRAEHESGAAPGILAEDFFRQLREKRQ